MKLLSITLFILVGFVLSTGMALKQQDEIELICVKKHNASNACHYNFKIGGVKYRYLDIGCKGKKDDVLKKAQAGKLGLAKDWKIECPEKKDDAVNQ